MKINRNIFWTENFFDTLANLGVKYICISPGSRSTPLTFAAASNKRFKCFVNIDERSSAFFALGLAKSSGKPAVVISTSGTATAELYPGIIEAYQQRVPLIICTADRPPELIGRGANQTINQDNIYGNHIRFYKNAGLPSASFSGIKGIRKLAEEAYLKSDGGPVHINFPFRKPFEPGTYTDDADSQILKLIEELKLEERIPDKKNFKSDKVLYKEILSLVLKTRRGLIIAGPMKFVQVEKKSILALAVKLNFPVIADACSQLRFGNNSKFVIANFEGFLGNNNFLRSHTPDIILQFGSTPSSKAIDIYIERIKAKRYIINEFGDLFDPWKSAAGVLKSPVSMFCEMLKKDSGTTDRSAGTEWLNDFIKADTLFLKEKDKLLERSSLTSECRIIPEVINHLQDNTHIMISNSMPVRDFDYFVSRTNKNIIVHTNRGASGIDGIISTALGIKKAINKSVLLMTGDMAFYYDTNALFTAKKYKIPLVIILINNNGGGIFGMLPISDYGKIFHKYFVSPHDLNFNTIVKSFGGNHKLIKDPEDLRSSLNKAFKDKRLTVLEIKTDIKSSVNLRKKIFQAAGKIPGGNFK